MRALRVLLLLVLAAGAGFGVSQLLYRSPAFRDLVGHATGRGQLLALTGGAAIYESETEQRGIEAVVTAVNLRRSAAAVPVSDTVIDRELHLLQFQFPNGKVFDQALARAGWTGALLREEVAQHLRGRMWIEGQIAAQLMVTDDLCRVYFERNREQFVQPPRFRVRHLFLAAPEGSPTHVVEQKRKVINALAARLAKGEALAALAAEASEDPHTKARGGDLGYFSAARMPEDFIAEVEKLSLGKPSAVVQTRLGFHILELMETKPETPLAFEQVREEIATAVRKEQRAAAVGQIAERLGQAEWQRTLP
ncbi:hypothetical protein BH20VER1_BH20VER1_29690 [soil metagenome]